MAAHLYDTRVIIYNRQKCYYIWQHVGEVEVYYVVQLYSAVCSRAVNTLYIMCVVRF